MIVQSSRNEIVFKNSTGVIPGGVNSPVRAFGAVGGIPKHIAQGNGAYLFDIDGTRYLDMINAWGPMILGHCYPDVVAEVQEQVKKGTVFGTPTELEYELASLVCSNVPGIDLLRLVNSGTEACMSAVRLARGYTGRSRIVKFEGCYHGHHDSFLVMAGSGALTHGQPSSAGVPDQLSELTLLAKYNNPESVAQLFQEHPEDIAAVIVEPVAGNMGCVLPDEGFLQSLRKICTKHGALLIFDEVMTGFRLAFGGAQELFQIHADLVCFGKVIGGGMPVAAFGGRREIMEHLAPLGPVYQAGTLSGNSIGVVAGLTTLRILQQHPRFYELLNHTGLQIARELDSEFNKKGLPVQINQIGSMLSVFFTDVPVKDLLTAKTSDTQLFARFFHHMLEHGIYLPPSQFESWFLSVKIGEEQVAQIVDAVGAFKV